MVHSIKAEVHPANRALQPIMANDQAEQGELVAVLV